MICTIAAFPIFTVVQLHFIFKILFNFMSFFRLKNAICDSKMISDSREGDFIRDFIKLNLIGASAITSGVRNKELDSEQSIKSEFCRISWERDFSIKGK